MNVSHKLQSNVSIIPEIGMVNDMKDAAGNKEGSKMYGGIKFQLDLK